MNWFYVNTSWAIPAVLSALSHWNIRLLRDKFHPNPTELQRSSHLGTLLSLIVIQ